MAVPADGKPSGLTDEMDEAVHSMSAIHARFLYSVVVFDDRRLWERDGATSMSAWLAPRYGLSKRTARSTVRVARALKRLPRIEQAYREGRLSWDQLQPLTRYATPETDALLARKAPSMRPAALVREAKRHERMRRRDAEEAYRLRSFAMWPDPELPVMYVEGALPAEQGEAVRRVLVKRMEEMGREERLAGVPYEVRMADAFVEVMTSEQTGRAAPATIVVHAQAEVIAGAEPAAGPVLAETEDGQRLASETVRRLACDGRILWLTESDGRPAGIGRQGRAVPGAMVRALRFRDQGCRFPGCERTTWVQAHHVIHWANEGPTTMDNLVLLCSTHHRMIHEGGWQVRGHPSKDLRFYDPADRQVGIRALPDPEEAPGAFP